MDIEGFLLQFGYVALMLGTMLEGETFLFLAALAAYQGILSLKWVLLFAYLGSVMGDQIPFFIGRLKGREFLRKRPEWRKRSEKVFRWLTRHRIKVLLFYRFMYGFRMVTPFVFGLTSIRARHFFLVNAVVAMVWTGFVAGCGYFLGQTLEDLGIKITHVELAVAMAIILVLLSVWFVHRRRQARAVADTDPAEPEKNGSAPGPR